MFLVDEFLILDLVVDVVFVEEPVFSVVLDLSVAVDVSVVV